MAWSKHSAPHETIYQSQQIAKDLREGAPEAVGDIAGAGAGTIGRVVPLGFLGKLFYCFWKADHWDDEPKPKTKPEGDGSGDFPTSWDPNDKLAPGGFGDEHFLAVDETFTYMVRFENMATADAPAHIVRVTDTFDDDLDLATLELTEIGFANEVIFIPDGHREYHGQHAIAVDNEYATGELVVQIDVTLNATTREMEMVLTGVDPLTGWLPEDFLLGLIYPNDDTGRGDGYLSYTIRPVDGLTTGTEITNKASIYFDWNDPIDTPLVLNTIDAEPPASQVDALPAEALNYSIEVSWNGSDEPGGSGIASYDIYVSEDGGEYELWLDDTADTSAEFRGKGLRTYAFYSVATDNVGHREAAPSVADAETTMPAAEIVGRHVFYNNSSLDGNDAEANIADDYAIAADKLALLPGETASAANYTSYTRGINGIMVDIDALPGEVTAADFEFEVNSAGDPDTWTSAPAPISITIRGSEGVGQSDRVTIIWGDNAIENQWVKMTVKANANTGLAEDDVFCFGNVIGDTGGDGQVGSGDYGEVLSQFGQTGSGLAADFNADGGVDFADFASLRSRYGSSVLPPTLPDPSPEVPAAAPPPLASTLSQPLSAYYAQSTDDPVAATPAEEIPGLLFESPGEYVSQSLPALTNSTATTLYRAATAERDLLNGRSARGGAVGNWSASGGAELRRQVVDLGSDRLNVRIDADILAESPLAVPL